MYAHCSHVAHRAYLFSYVGWCIAAALVASCKPVEIRKEAIPLPPSVIIEVPAAQEYNPCNPARGEDQEPEIRSHGHALDDIATECI